MKNIKRLAIMLTLIAILISAVSCEGYNMAIADTTYKFDKAIIFLPNGEKIEGAVESWLDFANSEE